MREDENTTADITSSSHTLFTIVIVLLGSPIFILGVTGHHWAWIALKVYLWTAIVFGTLLSLERSQLRRQWLWYALMPLLLLHGLLMCCLIYINMTNPMLDDFPTATYGAMLGLMVLEGNWFYKVLERRRAKA